jgi:hypothetical protein
MALLRKTGERSTGAEAVLIFVAHHFGTSHRQTPNSTPQDNLGG